MLYKNFIYFLKSILIKDQLKMYLVDCEKQTITSCNY